MRYFSDEELEMHDGDWQWFCDPNQRVDYTDKDMNRSCMRGINLHEAVLKNCNMTCCEIEYRELPNVNMQQVNLTEAWITGSEFTNADMTDANFKDARASAIRVNSSTLVGSTFTGADLAHAYIVNYPSLKGEACKSLVDQTTN